MLENENMETLYHQTNKLIQETQHLFSLLEQRQPNLDVHAVENEIESKIKNINTNCDRLDILCQKGQLQHRQNAKMKVDQLKYDSRHLSAALNSWLKLIQKKQQEDEERELLLARKFTANDHVDIMIDHSVQQNTRVRNAIHGVDDMISNANGILDNVRSQNSTIKGAHKRLVDVGNTLGLSNTTMRLIEQRLRSDKVIFFGGIILTVIIIVAVLYFT